MKIIQSVVLLRNNIRNILLILLVVSTFSVLSVDASANGGVMTVEFSQQEIEKLNNKIDSLILSNSTDNVSASVIGLANLQMQLITVILAVVGVGIPVFAFFFRKEIQVIKNKAMLSVTNMENEVNQIKLSERAITKRKKDIDRLYKDYEEKLESIDERMKKLKTVEGKPEERNKLEELEQEILKLKRKLSQGVQPYTWSVSPSASTASGYTGPITSTTSTSTSSFGAASPSSATTTTVEPFYPSPSPFPSFEPEDDESNE